MTKKRNGKKKKRLTKRERQREGKNTTDKEREREKKTTTDRVKKNLLTEGEKKMTKREKTFCQRETNNH